MSSPAESSPLLEVCALSYRYRSGLRRGERGLKELDLRVERGEIVGLLGPNGAGKSTAFELISGALRPQAGQVKLKGEALKDSALWERARAGLAYLSQRPALFEPLSALENVSAALQRAALSPADRERRAYELLTQVSLEARAAQRADQLSGGERQRLAIARLMALDPVVMLLDEPFTALDPLALEAMRALIFMLKERGVGLLITDHRAEQTISLCDRVYVLYEGEVIASGSPHEVRQHAAVRSVYLGEHST